MTVSVLLPQTGMGISEATIVRWLKNVGDRVEKDEALLEIETAKSTVEVEAPASGTLTQILAEVDEEIEVGVEIAVIEEG